MIVIAMINTRDNYISRDICSEIRDNKEIPPIDKVDKLDIVEQINSVLIKYYNLYKDTSYEVI